MLALTQLIRFLLKTEVKHTVIKCKIEMQNVWKEKRKLNSPWQGFCKQKGNSSNFGRAKLNLRSVFVQSLVALKKRPFIWYTNSIYSKVSFINIKLSLALDYLGKKMKPVLYIYL